MLTVEEARGFALSLPEATEQPHFEMSSFRVRGKIFATVPADEAHLHVFVDEGQARAVVAEDPAVQELWVGKRLRGVRVSLAEAGAELVFELLTESWRRRAPRPLVREFDKGAGG